MAILSNSLLAVALALVGPLPFIDLKPSLFLIYCAMALCGSGWGFGVVSSFARTRLAATKHGYPDDIATNSMLSGLWTSSFYLGNFLGPTLAGVLVDSYGFRWSTQIFFFCYITNLIATVLDLAYKKLVNIRKHSSGEREVSLDRLNVQK